LYREKTECRALHTPDSGNNEGVGEHVRTRFHPEQMSTGEIADLNQRSAPTKKTCFFCQIGPEGACAPE